MVLESTIICVDNSDWMRNGDFLPSRLQAQQDAVNLVAQAKLRSNPESNVGLVTLANLNVLVTLTTDAGKLLAKLHAVEPQGDAIKFVQGVRIAHLALKHRQGKNHKTRIVAFVGSPINEAGNESVESTLVKLAKKLKKEKVNVDVVSFGEADDNADLLKKFVETVNGKEASAGGSHLVTIPPGPHLSDALISSPILQSEDGSGPNVVASGGGGFDFGVDPNEDPELALALRVSMEEQRARQEAEAAAANQEAGGEAAKPKAEAEPDSEEALLQRALAMSMDTEGGEEASSASSSKAKEPADLGAMTEEEQIAYAMRMSMQDSQEGDDDGAKASEAMDVDQADVEDPAFLQSVLESLPGVDPQSEAVKSAIGSASAAKKDEDKKKKDEKDKK